MPNPLRRFHVHGDFWLRYLFHGARVCPWFLEPVTIWAFSLVFFLLCKAQRHGVAANLRVIRPGLTNWEYAKGTFNVIHSFAWSLADFAHVRIGQDVIDWEVGAGASMDDLANLEGGALLLTAHMGNYDVAAPLLAEKLRRRVHIVRAPERNAATQEYMRDKRADSDDVFVIHYNEPGSMLGVELARLLQDGEIVAIQGDRILFDVSPEEVEFRPNVRWRLPRGPFHVAQVARVPIVPVFIIRLGWRRYRIESGAPFVWQGDPRDRAGYQTAAMTWWRDCLRDVIERHWHQWFVFEKAFQTGSIAWEDEA